MPDKPRADWIGVEKITNPEQVTPDVLDRIAFTERRVGGGYKVEEVDGFIDVVVERMVQLMRDNEELRNRPAEVVPEVRAALDRDALMGVVAGALLAANEQARRDGKRAVVSPPAVPGVAETVTDAIIAGPAEPVTDVPVGLLAGLEPAEHRVVELLGQAWGLLVDEVVADGPTQHPDLAELIVPFHTIQNAVLAQAAARAYPQRYRLLGGTIEGEQEETTDDGQ